MKLIKTTRLVATVCAFVAFAASEAAAQTPTVTSTQNGNRITIQWNAIGGAASYDIEVTGTLSGTFQIPTTFVTVDAPPGNYVVRVRARAGGVVGPFSEPVTITVGPGGVPGGGACTPGDAPTVTVTTAGGVVTVSWTAVPGAAGYRVEFSRSPGGTELAQNIGPGQTQYSTFVPMIGTFYVRVTVGTACGTATSSEQSFTISSQNAGSGPRTPNPPAGQLLPRPGYLGAVVTQVANAYRGEFLNMCRNHTWLYRLIQALRQQDSRWGLNYVRGHAPRVSDDVVAYNPTDGPDEGAQQIYLWDVISGLDSATCDTSRQAPWTNDLVPFTWFGGPAGDWSICANRYCARWTLSPYLAAGFPADERQ